MNEGHLRQRLRPEQVSLEGLLYDDQLLVGETDRGLNLVWELCMNQIRDLRNRYIRSFSIIGDPWL